MGATKLFSTIYIPSNSRAMMLSIFNFSVSAMTVNYAEYATNYLYECLKKKDDLFRYFYIVFLNMNELLMTSFRFSIPWPWNQVARAAQQIFLNYVAKLQNICKSFINNLKIWTNIFILQEIPKTFYLCFKLNSQSIVMF